MAYDPLMCWEWEGGAVLADDEPDFEVGGVTNEWRLDSARGEERPAALPGREENQDPRGDVGENHGRHGCAGEAGTDCSRTADAGPGG